MFFGLFWKKGLSTAGNCRKNDFDMMEIQCAVEETNDSRLGRDDSGLDSDNIRKFLENQGVEAVIPPRSNRRNLCLPTTKRNIECGRKWNGSFVESRSSSALPLATTNWRKSSWLSSTLSAHSSLFNPLEKNKKILDKS